MIKIFCMFFPVASDINEFSRLILESLQGMLQMEEWLKIINDQLPRPLVRGLKYQPIQGFIPIKNLMIGLKRKLTNPLPRLERQGKGISIV